MSRRREQLLPGKPNLILFEYYTSLTDGPTVRIDVQCDSRLNELEDITRRLSSGDVQTIPLAEIENAHWLHLWQT
jgi:hypothetical protein